MTFGYQLTRRMNMSANFVYRELTFVGDNTREDFDVIRYRFNLDRNLSRDLSLSFRVDYEERSSASITQNYDELRGGVSLTYRFL
jgi:hypothetical protein